MNAMNIRPVFLLRLAAAAALLMSWGSAFAASFELGFDGHPQDLRGSPGDVLTFDAYVTLTVTENESLDGPQAWSYAVGARGGFISAISLDGITVQAILEHDHDNDPSTPFVRQDPFPVDLGTIKEEQTGFVINHVCNAEVGEQSLGKVGASVVVMSMIKKVTLQPSGTHRIARVTVQTKVPADGSCSPIELYVLQGADVICLDELGRRLGCAGPDAGVTHEGQSFTPGSRAASAQVCPNRFRRGDANSDGRVDISDGISTLSYLYLGGREPGCRDAADANDDAALDISDGILILNRLFAPGAGSVIPPPGIYACGTDPTVDAMSCREDAGC